MPDETPVLVAIRQLTKYYRRGEQIIPVLVDIDLDVALGDYVALMGPSGSGKTHLAQPDRRHRQAEQRHDRVGGVDIARLSEGELAAGGRRTSASSSSSTT